MTDKKQQDRPTITWDRPMLARIKTDYKRHVQAGNTQFIFDGHVFATAYVKYLIEYLEERLP